MFARSGFYFAASGFARAWRNYWTSRETRVLRYLSGAASTDLKVNASAMFIRSYTVFLSFADVEGHTYTYH